MTTTGEQFKKDMEQFKARALETCNDSTLVEFMANFDVDYYAQLIQETVDTRNRFIAKAELEEMIEDGEGLDELDIDELERYLKIAIELDSDHVIAVLGDELATFTEIR